MMTTRSVIVIRVFIVLLVIGAVSTGGYVYHRYHKRAMIKQSLAAGMAACDARRWSEAAAQLEYYLKANSRDLDILLKCADAQLRRRPKTRDTLEQAAFHLETILRIRSGHAAASQMLVRLYLDTRSFIEAERVARSWASMYPEDPQAAQSLAETLVAQKKQQEAISLLETLCSKHPERVDSASTLAILRASCRGNSIQNAIKPLDAAVKADPNAAAARLARARFLVATNRYAAARDDIERVEKAQPHDLSSQLGLATLLAGIGLYERADAQFNRAEKAYPNDPEVYLARARILTDTGNLSAGVRLADHALTAPLGEQRLDVLPVAAEFFAAGDRPQDARRCIEQLKASGGSAATVVYLEGLVSLAEGRIDDSIASLQEAVRLNPVFPQAHFALGRALFQAGDLEPARSSLEEAVHLAGGTMPLASVELARVYAGLARDRDAARIAVDAERHSPFNAVVVLTCIQMQGLLARPAGGQPDPSAIQKLLDRLQSQSRSAGRAPQVQALFARLTAWNGNLDGAADLLMPLNHDRASRLIASTTLSDIYAEAKRYDAAIEYCRAAIEAADQRQRISLQVRLAQLYAAAGQIDGISRAAAAVAALPSSRARSGALVAMAKVFLHADNSEQARQILQRVIREDDRNLQSRLLLLGILPAGDNHGDRQKLVDQIHRVEGENGLNWRIWQARLWLEQAGRSDFHQKTEILLKECLAKSPNMQEAVSLLAALYEKTGQSDQAVQMYEQCLRNDSANVPLAQHVLNLALQDGEWDTMDRLLTSLPNLETSLRPYHIARSLHVGDTQRAQKLLAAQTQQAPDDWRSRVQLADLLRGQGNMEEARRMAQTSGETGPACCSPVPRKTPHR